MLLPNIFRFLRTTTQSRNSTPTVGRELCPRHYSESIVDLLPRAELAAHPRISAAVLAFGIAFLSFNSLEAAPGIAVKEDKGSLRVEADGKPFTVYHPTGARRPYLHPIYGPTGKSMVRNWPEQEAPGEEQDHIHHRGLWFGHRQVNGVSFWDDFPEGGLQIHESFSNVRSGAESGGFTEKLKWVDQQGREICRDERTVTFAAQGEVRSIDFDVTITATQGALVFGDDSDGLMAIRLAETMRLKVPNDIKNRKAGKKPGAGHIVNATGVRDDETWGKRAAWCDYYGPVGGEIVGVAIFDHPENIRHPTWWHVRDYGLFSANPFGKRGFEKLSDPRAGELTLPANGTLRFRYRFVFHRGDEVEARIAERYVEYTRAKSSSR